MFEQIIIASDKTAEFPLDLINKSGSLTSPYAVYYDFDTLKIVEVKGDCFVEIPLYSDVSIEEKELAVRKLKKYWADSRQALRADSFVNPIRRDKVGYGILGFYEQTI